MRSVLLALMLLSAPAAALEPNELLEDSALEARARDISQGLRCLVCRNESIDESNAALARDMRLVVRERLLAGDSDAAVVAYIVDRYGEYALLRPRATGSNLILWIAGPVMLILAGGLAFGYLRRGGAALAPDPLSSDEEARLRRLLDDEG
ncbi:MAG: cytochrome c-type biogenesis protein [Pseudomonadota bacterium]